MKTLNIPLEDKEYKELEKLKGNFTWRGFLMNLIKEKDSTKAMHSAVKK